MSELVGIVAAATPNPRFNMRNVYDTGEVDHEADLSYPLKHGIIRYIPSGYCPSHLRNQFPSKNDKRFVYVPVGFVRREKDDFIDQILDALRLTLPNVVVVTPNSYGSVEEQYKSSFAVQDAVSHPVCKDWSQDEQKRVLQAKISQLLASIIESSMEVGAWLMPDCPRRKNGAAQMICDLLPKHHIHENVENGYKHVALGVIGLDEEKQDKEFKAALQEAMEPIGSPVQSVVKLKLDIKKRDSAPLAQLTHLLLFESPEEKLIFHKTILDLVPDFTVAFGNITDQAMIDIFETTKRGSPSILLQYSGANIAKLTKMFKHVKSNMGPRRDTSDIPPMADEKDELIRLFINTWPANFNPESVILADPLLMKGNALQKRLLNAISSCFSLRTGSGTIIAQRMKALKYAWSFHDSAIAHAKRKKFEAERLNFNFNILTLSSIIASVLYNKFYGPDGSLGNKSPLQLFTFIATILLPLTITTFKQEIDKNASAKSWAAFEIAAAKIYSEILKFRTQCGIYRVEDKTEMALQKPVEKLTTKIQNIWAMVRPFLKEDRMKLSKEFWDTENTIESIETVLESDPQKKTSDETTPLIESSDSKFGHEDPPEVEFVDDNYSPLRVDHYMTSRMEAKMLTKTMEIQSLVRRNDFIGLLIKLITIFSGGCAALSFQWAVPIVLGVSSSLGLAQDFLEYPTRIENGNDLIVELNELKLWWLGLSIYERELPQLKDKLVLAAEKVIVDELKLSFGTLRNKGERW